MKTLGQKKMVRKMKFISDQEGIMNRYLREQGNWTPHLDNTQQFILDSFQDKNIKKIAILGSGWLLDLPLEKLAKRFDKILLIDVFHPAQIVKKVAAFKNVDLLEADLTGGGIEFCWGLRKKNGDHFKKYILDDFKPKKIDLPFKPDAFVSVNLLNQLDILLVDYVQKKNGRFVKPEIDRFRKTIQQFHVDMISEAHACLITDIEEENTDSKGKTASKKLVHVKLPKGERTAEWTWDFDLSKKYNEGMETKMKVNAIEW